MGCRTTPWARPKPTETRNKARRPRDLLGRPQPWDAPNALELEDFDALTAVRQNHRLGREHLNAGRFFPAHEAWETAWKQSRDTTDAEFFKGLSQLGAGYVHLLRGNAHGAHPVAPASIGTDPCVPLGATTGWRRSASRTPPMRSRRGRNGRR